jgi:hypothetical protein
LHFNISQRNIDQEGAQNLASLGNSGNDERCGTNVNGIVDCNASIHNNGCDATVRDDRGLVETVCGINNGLELPDVVVGGVDNNVRPHNAAAVSNVGDGRAIVDNCCDVDEVNRDFVGVSGFPTSVYLRSEFASIEARLDALDQALRAEVASRDARIVALEQALRVEVALRDARIVALKQDLRAEVASRDARIVALEQDLRAEVASRDTRQLGVTQRNNVANAGLSNSGVVCYSNAIFQVLASCNHLTAFFSNSPSQDHERFRLYYAFAQVLHSMVSR